ncbi:RsmB/NOP family class I SAM-dependent RNA methyltransferase [Roseinatronobacter alkalisoli]|uniref:Transcription antitermination factor NusB n=1 Tax=Roseinatronobacter alkalisoli TaxID=3028235 RepID=A0ABT5TE55_9RHOB|nr:transcription antitermination factor NusB [Roseinatronobacter sp. HJB301]MDD7972452.1 transcription antitermination factor NusB [Roseinatronobacter sp. HJB301]
MPQSATLAPRAAALDLIHTVFEHRRSLSDAQGGLATLPPEARARAARLAQEGLRQMDRADHLLRRALRKTPPDRVLWVLRLATVEMLGLGAAAHGVINDAVALTRGWAGEPKLTGLVNAVLRQMAQHSAQDWAQTPVPRLPAWLRGALQNAYGNPVTQAIEAAHQHPAPLDLTLRDGAEPPTGLAGQALPTGTLRLHHAGQVSALPGYDSGAWWVQDAAASLPARLLGQVQGASVLDICAAPGGKTMQLAAAGAKVTALDMSGPRLGRLHENLARTGLDAAVVQGDALHWTPDSPFDAILLDAPCSATGTIRRHPELPHLRNRADVKALCALQAQLLDRVLDPAQGLLRAGGRVVYCTCSLLPDEGEAQASAAMARHRVQAQRVCLPGLPDDWRTPEGGIRTRPDYWPDSGGIDGFYMIVLQHMG